MRPGPVQTYRAPLPPRRSETRPSTVRASKHARTKKKALRTILRSLAESFRRSLQSCQDRRMVDAHFSTRRSHVHDARAHIGPQEGRWQSATMTVGEAVTGIFCVTGGLPKGVGGLLWIHFALYLLRVRRLDPSIFTLTTPILLTTNHQTKQGERSRQKKPHPFHADWRMQSLFSFKVHMRDAR